MSLILKIDVCGVGEGQERKKFMCVKAYIKYIYVLYTFSNNMHIHSQSCNNMTYAFLKITTLCKFHKNNHGPCGKNGVRDTTLKYFVFDTFKEDRNLVKMITHFHTWSWVKKYINTIINMVLYLEKDLEFASRSECQKNCSL